MKNYQRHIFSGNEATSLPPRIIHAIDFILIIYFSHSVSQRKRLYNLLFFRWLVHSGKYERTILYEYRANAKAPSQESSTNMLGNNLLIHYLLLEKYLLSPEIIALLPSQGLRTRHRST